MSLFAVSAEFPLELTLKQTVKLDVLHQDKKVGEMTLMPGRMVTVISKTNDWLIIQAGTAEGKVRIQDTDYEEQLKLKESTFALDSGASNIEEKAESVSVVSSNVLNWNVRQPFSEKEKQELITTLYEKREGLTLLQEAVGILWGDAVTGSSYPTWVEHLRIAQAIALWLAAEQNAFSLPQETVYALFSNKPLMDGLGSTLSPLDNPIGVWKVLADLQNVCPDRMQEYAALAVALAVVHDSAFPTNWPDSQAGIIPRKDGNWVELFQYFTDQDRANRLFLKLSKLEANQLKFVVDAPIDLSEFNWVNKNLKFLRREFDRAYFFVRYDLARLEKQAYDWPWKENYTLENIAKRNGICVDQAYFAFIAGKAKGMPTLIFSGSGKSGYHAWFGFMKADDQWEMDAGRYELDNYVVGEATDPQTWRRINDHQLQVISRRLTSTPVYRQSQNLLCLADLAASLNPSAVGLEKAGSRTNTISLNVPGLNRSSYQAVLQQATKICPANADVWVRLANWLEINGTEAELKSHYMTMSEQFKDQKDLKAWAQERWSQLIRESGDVAMADKLQKKIVNDNRRDRTDLGVAAAAELLQQKIENGEYDSALAEYQRIVRTYKRDGGGALFFDLVEPFILEMKQHGQDQIARKALQFTQDTMEYDHDPASQIQQGFEELARMLNVRIKGVNR